MVTRGRQRRRAPWILALTGVVLWVATSPAMAAFCETGIVHDYSKPLKSLPEMREPPLDEHLPFGPARVFLGSTGIGPIVIGPNQVGFSLSYSPFHRNHHRSPRLDWLVVARLVNVDRRGRVRERLGKIEEQVRWLRSSDDRPSGNLPFSFHVSKPALYRIEITFLDRRGKRLSRFGEYFRLVRPTLDARLTLNGTVFHPGETVSARLENYGTQPLFYGLDYSIESYDGAIWTRSSIRGPLYIPAIGLITGPGEAASCWKFPIPLDAPPGSYRFVWSGKTYRGRPFERGAPLTLTSEFEIQPTP